MANEKSNKEQDFVRNVAGYLHQTFTPVQEKKCKEFYAFAEKVVNEYALSLPMQSIKGFAALAYRCKAFVKEFPKIWDNLDELFDCILFALQVKEEDVVRDVEHFRTQIKEFLKNN